jgi:hypothetical protein
MAYLQQTHKSEVYNTSGELDVYVSRRPVGTLFYRAKLTRFI